MKTIRFLVALLILLTIATAASAQANPVSISVSVSCSSIGVGITSTYARAVKAQVYAGTGSLGSWDLVDDIGNYTRANANSSASGTYSFAAQRANTIIFYAVYVYDDVTSLQVATVEGSRDCDGPDNNSPSPSASPTPNSSGGTATFLAACNSSAGITIQVVGGTSFSVTASQISGGIASANTTRQNTLIVSNAGVTVTALTNNTILISGANGYSVTLAANACGTGTSGGGAVPTTSCTNKPADARAVHIVQAGENLFRIGLRYGVSYTRLASYNGIADATVIYVGQCIAIPPA